MGLHVSEVHVRDAVEEFREFFVSSCDGGSEFVAVDVKIVEESGKIALGCAAFGGVFNVVKDFFECFVEVVVVVGACANVLEEFGRKNEESFLLDEALACRFRIFVGHLGVAKVLVPGGDFAFVDVVRDILGYVAIEHRAENIVLEVPAVYRAAQFIRDRPDGAMEFVALLCFFVIRCHGSPPFQFSFFPFKNAVCFFFFYSVCFLSASISVLLPFAQEEGREIRKTRRWGRAFLSYPLLFHDGLAKICRL